MIILRNKVEFFNSKLEQSISQIYRINRDQSTIQYSAHIWLESVVAIAIFFSLLFLNNINTIQNEITEYLVVLIVSFRFIPSFSTILGSTSNIYYSKASIEKIMKFINDKDNNKFFKSTNLKVNNIHFKNISFKYQNEDKFLINDFNFSANFSSLIGIKGNNGSGKTTLLNIIAGLIKPEKGMFLVNGNNIYNDENLEYNWKKVVGFVDQNKRFSNQSIYETIAFGVEKDKIDKDKVYSCLKKVNLLDYFNSINLKLESKIGENGAKLSGGQIQRLNIARSLYHEPQILLFDEITNNLDQQSKTLIMNLIMDIKKNNIVFISTHSNYVLGLCDHIIDM